MQRIKRLARDENFDLQKLVNQSLVHRVAYPRLTPGLEGIELCRYYSLTFQETVRSVYKIVAGTFHYLLPVAVAVYGSPSRHEMASESDADILIVSRGTSPAEQRFRALFARTLEPFQFAKVDIPEWGTLNELKVLASMNIAEGNQVLEAIPIAGDQSVIRRLRIIQYNESTLDRALRNLIFQSNCFANYYANRQKFGMVNIKYSHGGTRDLLFFIWTAKLLARLRGDRVPTATISWAIEYLVNQKMIPLENEARLRNACSNMMLLRSEVLRLNKKTPLRGLSFLDPAKSDLLMHSKLVQHVFHTPAVLQASILQDQKCIQEAKASLLDKILKKCLRDEKYVFWHTLQTGPVTSSFLKGGLMSQSHLIRVMSIWEIGNRGYVLELKEELNQLIASRNYSWDVAASLLSLRDLEQKSVEVLATTIITKPGHGYLMRMIAQHPHVSRKTLKDICNFHSDKRYTDLARIALTRGQREANFQV